MAELLCAMIATFAKVCGLPYPVWDQQHHVDQVRFVESITDLSDKIELHNNRQQNATEKEAFDVSGWYRDNWRIFPWAEPDYENTTDLQQDFVVQVAEFTLIMAGHFGTQVSGTAYE